VNRFVRSPGYVKVRAFSGGLFIVLGAVILVRTVLIIGIGLAAIAPLVMGIALVGLGALRWRDYLRLRSGAG